MTNDFELSRRTLLGSLGAVGLASAGAGLGTSAYFTDEESFAENTLAAGELDLKVDWEEHYSYPQVYGFDDPTDGLTVTRSKPSDTSSYVGLPDPENPVVWVHEDDLDAYMANTAVEAFPDPDGDGQQEVETQHFTYDPCADGADLPDDLDTFAPDDAVVARTKNGDTYDGTSHEPLVNLTDVKPGDFGELTLSVHLCDNPGYVWLQAANVSQSENGTADPESAVDTESGGELAERIETIWWYDARGDNVPPRTDCGEKLYLSETGGDDATELYEVDLDDAAGEAQLTKLLPNGQSNSDDISSGNFDQTDAIAATPMGDEIVFYDKTSGHLGRYVVDTGAFSDEGAVDSDPGGVVLAGYSPSGTLWAASQHDDELYTVDPNGPSATSRGDTGIDLSGADLAFAADGTLYVWTSGSENGLYEVTDPEDDATATPVDAATIGSLDTDVTGLAIREGGSGDVVVSDNASDQIKVVDRTDGSVDDSYDLTKDGTGFDHVFGDMTAGQFCGEVFHRGTLAADLDTLASSPVPLDGNRASDFDEFAHADDDPDRECFDAGVTHYVGFGWWLPASVGNEVQGDGVSFDLGFYTEQCRDNDGSYDGP
jgi:predicted ribosomally synthesized peptide with SipW-like signal peptide